MSPSHMHASPHWPHGAPAAALVAAPIRRVPVPVPAAAAAAIGPGWVGPRHGAKFRYTKTSIWGSKYGIGVENPLTVRPRRAHARAELVLVVLVRRRRPRLAPF